MKIFSIQKVQVVIAVAVISVVFGVAYFLNPSFFVANKVGAALNNNVSGWAWSENIGWISFNCITDNTCAGDQNYGVSINATSGDFSGLAWSENVGYISFNHSETGAPPAGGAIANYNKNTGKVTGWARALSACGTIACTTTASEGGWDGWISLSGMTNEATPKPYGVTISNNLFSGYAWNDVVIGWIDFAPKVGGIFVGVRLDAPPCTTSNVTSWGAFQPLGQCIEPPATQPVPAVRVGVCATGGTVLESGTVNQTCTVAPVTPTGSTEPCGNGICGVGETLLTCPRDCKGNVKQI